MLYTIKDLLNYGKILYDHEIEHSNTRVRIIKREGEFYYTEQNNYIETIINLSEMVKKE